MTIRLHLNDDGEQTNGHPLSDRAAQQEAERRFGADGAAWHHPQATRGTLWWCCIGLRRGDCINEWLIAGKGPSWAAAFADAAARRK